MSKIINDIGFDDLADNIHGDEYDRFLYVLVDKYKSLGVNEKAHLINNLCKGATSKKEEETIVMILKDASSSDFKVIVHKVGKGKLYSNLTGREENQFEEMLESVSLE